MTLTSGKVLEDVTVKEEGDSVRVTKADGSSALYPKRMIRSIEKKATTVQELADRRKSLAAKDVAGRLTLAAWCEERKLAEPARDLYREVLAIDSECAQARLALGHLPYEDRWHESEADLIAEESARAVGDLGACRALIAYCREHGFSASLAPIHEKILALDPEDGDARLGLGHVKIGDKWYADLESMVARVRDDPLPAAGEDVLAGARACARARRWDLLSAVVEAGRTSGALSNDQCQEALRDTPFRLGEDGVLIKGMLFRVKGVSSSDSIPLLRKGHTLCGNAGTTLGAPKEPAETVLMKEMRRNPDFRSLLEQETEWSQERVLEDVECPREMEYVFPAGTKVKWTRASGRFTWLIGGPTLRFKKGVYLSVVADKSSMFVSPGADRRFLEVEFEIETDILSGSTGEAPATIEGEPDGEWKKYHVPGSYAALDPQGSPVATASVIQFLPVQGNDPVRGVLVFQVSKNAVQKYQPASIRFLLDLPIPLPEGD